MKTLVNDNSFDSDQISYIGPKKDNTYQWNVIGKEDFKERLLKVFGMVSDAIINTLGPYGSQVIIDEYGEPHITKDGWSLLRRLRFNDDEMVLNNILSMLIRIAGPVVSTVGDGSSSSIAMSNVLYKNLVKDERINNLRSKEKQDLLIEAAHLISQVIQENATEVDKSGDLHEIYKLAHVSTNGNDAIAAMIQDIYNKTGNPTIYYKEAKGAETSYEVVEGYKLNAALIDPIYITTDEGNCDVTDPYFIMFDHKIDNNKYYPVIIQSALNIARNQNRKLIVMAPYISRNYLMAIAHDTKARFNAFGDTDVIYTHVSTANNVLADYFSDFAILTGGQLITEMDYEKYVEIEKYKDECDKEGKEYDGVKVHEFDINNFIGQSKFVSINMKDMTASGLDFKNENLYGIHMKKAVADYEAMRESNRELNRLDVKEYELKQRVSKLKCSMGNISVGGMTSLERQANLDLVEDAVKATESAYVYGYNIGGSLAITQAVYSILRKLKEEGKQDSDIYHVCSLIGASATAVYSLVLSNKYENDTDKVDEIIKESLKSNKIYDLVKDEYSTEVINSCRTDIEILKASISVVSLLLSSSLFVSINPSVGNGHGE